MIKLRTELKHFEKKQLSSTLYNFGKISIIWLDRSDKPGEKFGWMGLANPKKE